MADTALVVDPAMNIRQRMAAAMGDIDAIGKGQWNEGQKFWFRGIDDVMNELHPVLAKYGIVITPSVIERVQEQRAGRNGSINVINLHVLYTFSGPAGGDDIVTADAWGEGMDSGDKATGKAMSAALKTVLLQVFLIPTKDLDDADKDATDQSKGENKRPPNNQQGQNRPAQQGQQQQEERQGPQRIEPAPAQRNSDQPQVSPKQRELQRMYDHFAKLGVSQADAQQLYTLQNTTGTKVKDATLDGVKAIVSRTMLAYKTHDDAMRALESDAEPVAS